LDVVVNVKPNAAAAAFREYSADLERALARLSGSGSASR
jgi:hypothetical protein